MRQKCSGQDFARWLNPGRVAEIDWQGPQFFHCDAPLGRANEKVRGNAGREALLHRLRLGDDHPDGMQALKNSLCIRVVVLNWVVKILGHHRPLLYDDDDDDGECVMMDDDDNDGDDGDDDGWMDGWTDGWTEG